MEKYRIISSTTRGGFLLLAILFFPKAAVGQVEATLRDGVATDSLASKSAVANDAVSVSGNCVSCKIEWTPLCARNLRRGWLEPWIAPPGTGCSGAPRQGWLNAADGFFTREDHLFYSFTDAVALPGNQSHDSHTGMYQLQLPISRRLWMGLDIPITSNSNRSNRQPSVTKFDDVRVTAKVMIEETRNRSLSTELGVRIPTGDSEVGAGIASLTPKVNLWRDIGNAWSFRSAIGVEIPTSGTAPTASEADLLYNLALGQTITPHESVPFGDFTYYLSLNGRTQLDGVQRNTILTLTPGTRSHLGGNIFFLNGLEIPVSGPNPFDTKAIFMFVRGF